MCSSQTEPISACCRCSCRHQGDVYEGWFQVTFIIHLDLVCIYIPKNRFLGLVPKPAFKLNINCIFFVFQGMSVAGCEYHRGGRPVPRAQRLYCTERMFCFCIFLSSENDSIDEFHRFYINLPVARQRLGGQLLARLLRGKRGFSNISNLSVKQLFYQIFWTNLPRC